MIYSLQCSCHPDDGVRYVGKTMRTLPRRLAEHKRMARAAEGTAVVYKWMRRHGIENIAISLLEHSPSDIDAAEAYWIAHFRAQNAFLLNMKTNHPAQLVN